jgi:hypothetical protein
MCSAKCQTFYVIVVTGYFLIWVGKIMCKYMAQPKIGTQPCGSVQGCVLEIIFLVPPGPFLAGSDRPIPTIMMLAELT